uniref:Uncharacterized protein n=1 Tax=Brassica oleracea var. oleracea TaxID=109376 RepID=A0A0D3ATW4_BRAOL
MRLALAKLWKFKYKKIDVDEPVSIVDEDDPASHLLPIQWPQPQNEEIFLAMEEAAFEEKVYLLFSVFFHWSFRISLESRRESLHRKKLRVIEEEDGDGNSNTGSCTEHIPEINIILLPAKTETHKKNMIQVSNTKKPLFFYVNLAPSLHTAITMVVTISEILKNIGLTTKKKVLTSTVGMNDEAKGNMVQKAKASFTTLASSSL